jgi:hypothetical protein
MRFLRADTATTVAVGPFVDATDGVTPETSITNSTHDVHVIKHNSTTAVDISASGTYTWTEVDPTNMPGWYTINFTAALLDTEGHLVLTFEDNTTYVPLKFEFMVMNANAFDALFESAGTDYLDVNVEQINGQNVLGAGTSGDKWRG